jgi:MFS transporter, DHA3 family, multidrug efflux protein
VKTFYQLLINMVISGVTNMTVWFALTFFVYLETQAVIATGIVSGIYLVTVALSGFWLGGLVDRYPKKKVMLLSSFVTLGFYIVGLAVFLASSPEAFKTVNSVPLWLFVVTLLFGVIAGNLRGIAVPTIVTTMFDDEQRDKANGMVGTASGTSFLVVSVISGFLVAYTGMRGVMLLAIATTIATIVHLWTIPIPEREIAHTDENTGKLDIRGTIRIISSISGLFALIFFTTFNNFLGGVFMSLMDAYGLSLVSVQVWGLLWGLISLGFIVGGVIISRWGLGRNPLRSMFAANFTIWTICSLFTIQRSIELLTVGMFIYLCVVPFIEAAEHTIIQKVVPHERQGRVFGFAQSIEMAASPLTAFMVGPIAQFVFIPFMTTGRGVDLIGSWYGVGADRGMALLFTAAGLVGLLVTFIAMRTKYYKQLSDQYTGGEGDSEPTPAHRPERLDAAIALD